MVIFEISPLVCGIANPLLKQEYFKLSTKNVLSGYFWAKIWKNYCHIWNQHLWVCQNAKFHIKPKKTQKKQTQKQKKTTKNKRKRKKIKFGTKIVLLGVGFGLEFEKSLSYLKPSILNLSNFQVIGPKLPSLSIFKLEFEKSSVIFEINTLEFIKIKFLTFLVNFDIASTFSKGPGSQFFWRSESGFW